MRDLLYRFHFIRKIWWKVKEKRNQEFNDREKIQERFDLGETSIRLEPRTYIIDRTIYIPKMGGIRGSARKVIK